MIRSILAASLRFRLLVVGIAVGVLAVGIVQLRKAPVDVLPEFSPPYVEIQTEALGLSAQEVEQLITVPLEADLLNGVQGVDVIRSESIPGLSSIVLVFEPGTDLYRARQLVQEPLTQAHALPNVSKPPTMLPPLSSSSRVLMIGLSSKELSPIERSVIARWTVRPRLMGVQGVANVAIWGMRDQQIQVQVDPEQLRERNVTLNQVIATTGNAQVASPVSFLEASTPGTGGFIETPQQRLQVRNVLDQIADPKELGKVPVEGTGGRLRLSDVSNVRIDHQPLIGDAVVDDGEGLLLVVEKFPGADTLEVTNGVEAALEQLRPGLAGISTDTSVFRPATFIEDAIDNIGLGLLIAAVLLVLAVAALLHQWRTVLVTLVTIPVALIAAALVMDALGESFNAISFAGLAVAAVIVIDEAIVSAENLTRRLGRDPSADGSSAMSATVVRASHEMRSPLTYATLIALLPIVPIAIMEGRPGDFFDPLVLAYALALAAAMLVALTLSPALSMMLFSRGVVESAGSPLLRRLAPRYGAALLRFIRRPRVAIGAAAGIVGVGAVVLPLLGTSPVPSFEDRDLLVRLDAEPGTSQPKMTRIAAQATRELRSLPGVEDVGAHVGRAVTGDQIGDVNSSEVWVSIDPHADYNATLESVENAVARVPAVERDVVTYTSQRIRDVGGLDDGKNQVTSDGLDLMTGSDRPLVVRVYGQNQQVLRRQANRVRRLVSRVDGVEDPRVAAPVSQPTLEIEVDLDRAQRQAIKPGDVRRAEAALLQGIQVGSVFEDQKVFDVIVQGVPETRESPENIRNLLLDRPGGGHVRLGDVAEVRTAQTPISIRRDAVSRYLDIEANVSGRALGAVASDIENRLARVSFPLEYHAEVFQRTTGEEIDATKMLAFAVAAAIAAFLLLQAAFASWRLALLVFLTLPVGLVGGLLAALLDGAELSLGALIAFLALLGLTVRTAVVLTRRFQELEREGERFGPALVEQGARERFAPMLATGLAAALVMLPFVVAGTEPGLEILNPMAVVILGGLITWLAFGLFLLPALYLQFARARPAGLGPADDVRERWVELEHAPPAVAAGDEPRPTTDGAGAQQ
jgi:CzcA family heavy metal efflux pump